MALIAVAAVFGAWASAGEPRFDAVRINRDRGPAEERPVFSFGLMTDVQYADKPNRRLMYYRSTVDRLRKCITELNRHQLHFTIQLGDIIDGYKHPDKTQQEREILKSLQDLDHILPEFTSTVDRLWKCIIELNRYRLLFTIQLGDIIDFTIQLSDVIDGYTRPDKTQQEREILKSRRDLDRILPEFSRLNMKLYHVIGNHCIRAGRETVQKKLGLTRAYYDFVPEDVEGWRMVVLDSMGVGYGQFGDEQTKWLEETLAKAKQRNERVILFNHFPLLKETATRYRVVFMQNQETIRDILDWSGCVVAYFAGHDHAKAYAMDRGIHHVTFPAMAEAYKSNAYAIIDVFDDRIEIHGFGNVPSRTLPLKDLVGIPQKCRPGFRFRISQMKSSWVARHLRQSRWNTGIRRTFAPIRQGNPMGGRPNGGLAVCDEPRMAGGQGPVLIRDTTPDN